MSHAEKRRGNKEVSATQENVRMLPRGQMKTISRLVRSALALGAGLLWLLPAKLCAQGIPETEASSEAIHVRQLTAERGALLDMLNDGNTPEDRRASIQRLLEWNTRGLTIAEVKKMNTVVPVTAPASATPLPPVNNLAEAEAAPLPANVNAGGGSVLQNFSKGRDAEAASKAISSLGLVKVQQDMDNATRESEAKLREAQNVRNQAGASALAQRQQDAASAASQQAAGGMGAVLGDSLVQSVQQGAQAAGQAIGGGAAGRMSSVAGAAVSGGGTIGSSVGGGGSGEMLGGAAAAGASAAAGQIFSGGTAPAVTPAAVPGEGQPVAPVNANMEAAADMSAFRSAGKRVYVPNSKYQTDGRPYLPPKQSQYQTDGRPAIPNTRQVELSGMQQRVGERDRRIAQPILKPGAEMSGVAISNPRNNLTPAKPQGLEEAGMSVKNVSEPMHWVQSCPRHGKYYGKGALTSCPKCVGYIR